MERIVEDPQEGKAWDAGAHVTRTFVLYRQKPFIQRLDIWPLLLLLLLFSSMMVQELAMIADQQTTFQQRQAAAAAARCVKTADIVLLVFHAPHVTAAREAEEAAATARGKWQRGSETARPWRSQRERETLQEAPLETGRDAKKVAEKSHRDTVKKKEGEREDETNEKRKERIEEEEEKYMDNASAKKKKERTEEEKDLFPVLSWLFSSLWFVYTLALLFFGGLLHLSTHWWVTVETLVCYRRVSSVRDATHVLVVPNCSRDVEPETLCEIQHLPTQIFFFFRKKKYIYDHELGRFLSLKFPKDLPLRDYFDWKGLEAAAPSALQRKKKEAITAAGYGRNSAAGREGEKYRPRDGATPTVSSPAAAAVVTGGATGRRGDRVFGEEDAEGKAEGCRREETNTFEDEDRYISPSWKGKEGERLVSVIEAKYGKNEYDLPIPSFKDLFREHAVAPFFVFQVFSISLWLLDEYWHYSVLMLIMLLFLECQMVAKRLKDFQQLRSMRMPPFPVSVYRNGAWNRLVSDQLLPGDIFALCDHTATGEAAVVCPVDALLLQGMVVVNEASLTGESVPQTKIALDGDAVEGDISEGDRGGERKEGKEDKECMRLDMKRRHKQHVVFAGTSILLHRNENGHYRKAKVPEKGCVAFVLRTAFSTTQGKLVRTILFSHGRVTVSSREAWLFLGILLLLALAASSYVIHASLSEGLQYSPSRRGISSRFKLFLACSHIVMAVVPAEFPITLSLAVTMSLIFLITKKIFCTEPFRVPYAGQVDICAFDKTGTLTSDFMRMRGVYGTSHAISTFNQKEKLHVAAAPQAMRDVHKAPETKAFAGAGVGSDSERMETHILPHFLEEHVKETLDQQSLPFETTAVMGCCHTLATVEGQLLGDPMEKVAFTSVGWQLLNPDTAVTTRFCPRGAASNEKHQDRLFILKRFPFTSELQRMFVVARHEGPAMPWCGAAAAACTSTWQQQQQVEAAGQPLEGQRRADLNGRNAGNSGRSRILVAGKGSPEVMRAFLKEVPAYYDILCQHFCLRGYRVLSLAFKEYACGEGTAAGQEVLQQLKDRHRVEKDLWFAGFLVLTCPIKKYTKEDLCCIRAAGHRVVMITGDNPLTACQVAREVGLFSPLGSYQHMFPESNIDMTSSTEQQFDLDNCNNIEKQQRHHDRSRRGHGGELGLTLCPAHEQHEMSKNKDIQGYLSSRQVLILNAKQQVVPEVGDPAPASYASTFVCDDTAGGPSTYAETASARPAHGANIQSREREYGGKHGTTREATASAGGSFVNVSGCNVVRAADKHSRAPTAADAASSPLSFASVRNLFYWESPEGRIVVEANCIENFSHKKRGRSPVFREFSSSAVSTARGEISTTSCSSANAASSASFPTDTTTDTCTVSSASATASLPCFSPPSCTSFCQSSLFSRPGSRAPLIRVPQWLVPVLSVEALAQLAATYELCVTGAALDHLFVAAGATTPQHQVRLLQNLVPYVAVYARMSPQQKELVLVSMNSCGHITLMCGDGTNDVGALKAAHVGVSLLCHETAEKEDSHNQKYGNLAGKKCNKTQHSIRGGGTGVVGGSRKDERAERATRGGSVCRRQSPSHVRWQSSAASSTVFCPAGSQRQISTRIRWQTYLEGALQQADADDDPPLVRLGDASVASPFTYKGDSISGVKTILRAGRATLVTVVMMYKLMALNSVVTAFSLSVLTLDGVKLGDLQTTLENFLCTVLTLLISKTQATVENMSTSRPVASVFHPIVLLSLIGQAGVHCFTLHASWMLTRADRGVDWDPDIEGPFEPNLVNTVVFLLIASMHASTFLSNYEGAPFMKPLRENRPFCMTLGILLCSLGVLVLEIFPNFNTWLSLVPFPSTACKVRVIQLMAVDILGAWAIGWATRKLCWWCARNRSKLPKFLH